MSSVSVLKEPLPDRTDKPRFTSIPQPVTEKERIVSIDVRVGLHCSAFYP